MLAARSRGAHRGAPPPSGATPQPRAQHPALSTVRRQVPGAPRGREERPPAAGPSGRGGSHTSLSCPERRHVGRGGGGRRPRGPGTWGGGESGHSPERRGGAGGRGEPGLAPGRPLSEPPRSGRPSARGHRGGCARRRGRGISRAARRRAGGGAGKTTFISVSQQGPLDE